MRNIYWRRKIGLWIMVFIMTFGTMGLTISQAIDLSETDIDGISNIANTGNPPDITALSAIVINAETGQILYEKDSHESRYPASTTKIETAILALEKLEMGEIVTADSEVVATSGNSMNLKEGEEASVKDLLYAMMLSSANDAASALAKQISGSIQDFASLMNQRAAEAGARNTNFNNANGMPDKLHVTTAYDMAMITKDAMQNEQFRTLVSTINYEMGATNLSDSRSFKNGNRLIWDTKNTTTVNGKDVKYKYEGAIGVKTGYTEDAGSCLVAAVNKDGQELIAVVLGSEKDKHYSDMISILNYCYSTYEPCVLVDSTSETVQYQVKVKHSPQKKITTGLSSDVVVSVPKGSDISGISVTVNKEKKYEAPIVEGDVLGAVDVYYGDVLLGTVDLVSYEAAEQRQGIDILWLIKLIFIILVVLVVIYFILRVVVTAMYRRKKRAKKAAAKKAAAKRAAANRRNRQ